MLHSAGAYSPDEPSKYRASQPSPSDHPGDATVTIVASPGGQKPLNQEGRFAAGSGAGDVPAEGVLPAGGAFAPGAAAGPPGVGGADAVVLGGVNGAAGAAGGFL